MTLADAVERMRGEKGKPITLTVLREGEDEPLEITIIRDIIKIRAVRSRVEGADENIAYIRVTTFNAQTTRNLKKALSELPAQIGSNKLAGFIIDLRNNPGGLLSQAVKVADTLLDYGEIVSTRGRHPDDGFAIRRRGDMARDISGGDDKWRLGLGFEIVAGALQTITAPLCLARKVSAKVGQTIVPRPIMGQCG